MSGDFTHRPSKVVKRALLDLSLGTEVSDDDEWPIFVDHFGDAGQVTAEGETDDIDNNLICVFNTFGIIHDRIQVTSEFKEDHGIQILIRSSDEPVGYAKSKAIAEAMDKNVNRRIVSIESSVYMIHSMNRLSDINRIGPELETKRRVFTVNYTSTITQIS